MTFTCIAAWTLALLTLPAIIIFWATESRHTRIQRYRRKGATTRSPLQWQPEKTEQAFTSFKRADPEEIETYGGRNGVIDQ